MKKLLLAIGFTLINTPLAQASFSDVPADHPYSEAINWAQENNIVNGFSDGTFKPDQKINRAELTKIIIEANFEDDEIYGEDCFDDVHDEWFAKYICTAKREGIVKGYRDRKFRPEKKIDFAEASKIITLSIDLGLKENEDRWHVNYLKYLSDNKAIPPSITHTDPDITRSEFVEIIWRLKEKPKNIDFSFYTINDYFKYKYKSGKIYFNDKEMKGIIDPTSFIAFDYHYSKDRHFVYYDAEKIEGAHSDSFVVLDNFYAKDKNFVYCIGEKIENADPASFTTLDNQYYTKDKNFVYYRERKLDEADVNSFIILNDKFHAKDKNNCYKFSWIVPMSECDKIEAENTK